MQRASPIARVHRIAAPYLLMAGGSDLRVPPAQSRLMHRALAARGVPSRLIWYPDDSHGLFTPCTYSETCVHNAMWLRHWYSQRKASQAND